MTQDLSPSDLEWVWT